MARVREAASAGAVADGMPVAIGLLIAGAASLLLWITLVMAWMLA